MKQKKNTNNREKANKRLKKELKVLNSTLKGNSININCSVLQDRSISVLEAISEYLKDKKGLSYHEIAILLNRDDRTIWTCYSRAKKKRPAAPKAKPINIAVPSSTLRDRTVSVLESIAEYLMDSRGMSYHEIAVALNRDDRTIWTCYARARAKRGGDRQ